MDIYQISGCCLSLPQVVTLPRDHRHLNNLNQGRNKDDRRELSVDVPQQGKDVFSYYLRVVMGRIETRQKRADRGDLVMVNYQTQDRHRSSDAGRTLVKGNGRVHSHIPGKITEDIIR